MAGMVDRFLDSWLARVYDLRDPVVQWYRLRFLVPVQAGTPAVTSIFRSGSDYPWAWLGLSWASNRANDHRWIEVQVDSPDFNFLFEPTKLGAFGNPDAAGVVQDVPATLFGPNTQTTFRLLRTTTVDPAETYPGPAVESSVDLLLWGLTLFPKGARREHRILRSNTDPQSEGF